MVVRVADGHRRSVEHEGLVEQIGLAIHRALQPLEEVRQQRDVVLVDLAELPDAFLRRAVMRRIVEPAIDAAARIDATGTVAAHLEREDARRVRREREHLEIEHQLDVFVERIGHSGRRTGQLARLAARVTGFDARDALLDLPDVARVLIQALPVRRSQGAPQIGHLVRQHVENAAVGRTPLGALLRIAARAEQLLEHHARVSPHRQRLVLGGPTDRVGVDARVAVGAAAGLIDRLDGELHRWNRRVLAELLRVQLVHRDADFDIGSFGQLRVRLRVHDGARAEMIAAHFGSRHGFRHARVGVADDRQVIAKPLQRAEAAFADVELPAGRGGTPEILGQTVLAAARRAVDLLDADKAGAACRPRGRRLRERGSCGNHRVEKWQRDGGAHTTQHGATRQVLLGQ